MTGDLSRRSLLFAGTAAAAMTLLPGVSFAEEAGGQQTKTVTGTFPPDIPDWFYLPVDVPRGVKQIDGVYSYDPPQVPAALRGNAWDIGIFGPEGHELGNERGVPGWSGAFRGRLAVHAPGAPPA